SSWGDQSRLWRYHGVAVLPFYYYTGVLGLQYLLHGRVIYASAETPDETFPANYDKNAPEGRERDTRLEPKESFWKPFWKGGKYYPTLIMTSSSQVAYARGLAVAMALMGVF